MHQNTDYGREMLDGVEAGLQELEMSLTAVETHSPTETNFLNTLLRLREADCEVVLLGTILGDTMYPANSAISAMGCTNGWQRLQLTIKS